MTSKTINATIPEELHRKIMVYNAMSVRQINITKAVQRALGNEMEDIEREMIQDARNTGTIPVIYSIAAYEELHKMLVENHEVVAIHTLAHEARDKLIKILDSEGFKNNVGKEYIILYPINNFTVKEDMIILMYGTTECIRVMRS